MARIVQTADLTPDAPLSKNHQNWIYNGLDCMVTLEVLNELLPMLDNTTANTYNFARDLQGPVLEMTTRGIKVDKDRRQSVLRKYKHDLMMIGGQLDAIVEDGIGIKGFNWKSPAQLKKLFYEVFGFKPILKRNANGEMAPTVNRDALEKLSAYFLAEPICLRLLLLRDIDKKRTFLETQLDPDGRIRTNLNIAGTNTGRLASSMSVFGTGTNLQNVDRELRSVFIADDGYVFVNFDLEQADARNVGALCWDIFVESHGEKFAGAYLDMCEGGDLHTQVARMVWPSLAWGDDPAGWRAVADQLFYRQDSYRQMAKKLGHGTNYYGTPATMAKHTKVDRSLVEDFQRGYFKALPCIPEWHKWTREQLQEFGYLIHLFGRRRGFFGRADQDATLREAIAYSPQGMTAEEINIAILRLFNMNICQLLIQVHDSELTQIREDRAEKDIPVMLAAMPVSLELKKGRTFTVPVEAKWGWNWADRDKEGTENPDGLVKWKGSLDRTRTEKKKLSLASFL